jgi:hypothetical protein
MFKRAIQTNHWMAIGLEKWNELENLEITPELVRKMRKIKYHNSDSEEDEVEPDLDSDAENDDIQSNDESEDEVVDSDGDSAENADSVESKEGDSAESEEEAPPKSSFSFCPICPGKKFLTDADQESHMKSAKHMKREAQSVATPEAVLPSVKAKKPKEKTKTERAEPAPKNNRKARRAHLANLKPNQ